MLRRLALPILAVAMTLGLSACTPTAPASPTVEVGETTIVLDVRTAAEFSAGHLVDAVNLDFNGGEVTAAIPSLDHDAEYLVYCRSGNRSAQAIALMEQAGFTDVTTLGSLEQAAQATGIEIVK